MSSIDPEFGPTDNDSDAIIGMAASGGVACSIAVFGGVLCSWMLDQFGEHGAIALWPLGYLGGYLVQRFPRCEYSGIIVSVGLVLAFIVAEVLWIQTNIQGADELSDAISMFPTFLMEFKHSVFIATIFLVFGILAALRTANQRRV